MNLEPLSINYLSDEDNASKVATSEQANMWTLKIKDAANEAGVLSELDSVALDNIEQFLDTEGRTFGQVATVLSVFDTDGSGVVNKKDFENLDENWAKETEKLMTDIDDDYEETSRKQGDSENW